VFPHLEHVLVSLEVHADLRNIVDIVLHRVDIYVVLVRALRGSLHDKVNGRGISTLDPRLIRLPEAFDFVETAGEYVTSAVRDRTNSRE
jgi:hypothetical protein